MVGSGGTILKTTNSGGTWTSQSSGVTAILNAVHFVSPMNGYAVGDSGTILKTVNGGTIWVAQNSGLTGSFRNLYAVYAVTDNIAYAVGQNGNILKTVNGGTNWVLQNSGLTNGIFSVYCIDASTAYAAGYTKVLKTTDGGSTWILQNTGINGTYDNLNGIFFTDANTGYTVGNKGRILKTTNGGGIGIEEHLAEKLTAVFPNPASDVVTLWLNQVQGSALNVNVYDVAGNLVKSELLSSGNYDIPVGDLGAGVYLIEIQSKEWIERHNLIISR